MSHRVIKKRGNFKDLMPSHLRDCQNCLFCVSGHAVHGSVSHYLPRLSLVWLPCVQVDLFYFTCINRQLHLGWQLLMKAMLSPSSVLTSLQPHGLFKSQYKPQLLRRSAGGIPSEQLPCIKTSEKSVKFTEIVPIVYTTLLCRIIPSQYPCY